MKQAVMILALALGTSALTTMAQEEGTPPKRDEASPPRGEQRYERQERRSESDRPRYQDTDRRPQPENARPGPGMMHGRRWQQGPPEDFAQRGRGFGAGGGGQGYGRPPFRGERLRRAEGVCPCCGRPFPARAAAGGFGRGPGFGRPGFGPECPPVPPRDGLGPMRRGFGGAEGRWERGGPGFGPGGSGPGFRRPAFDDDQSPLPPRGEFRQQRRAPASTDLPEGRPERPAPPRRSPPADDGQR